MDTEENDELEGEERQNVSQVKSPFTKGPSDSDIPANNISAAVSTAEHESEHDTQLQLDEYDDDELVSH